MYRFLFGPVPSRRLGLSLGVDLVPHKVCSLNCVYCECGRTTQLTVRRAEYVPVDPVLEEIAHYLSHHPQPDFFTFSGAGEPTLNSRLGEVIDFIHARCNHAQVAVLTNATLLDDPQVRAELCRADLVLPSLDAASERVYRRMDRPSPRVRLDRCLEGLVALRSELSAPMWLEVMILPGYNDDDAALLELRSALARIRPDRIQLNTLDRPGTEANLQPATREALDRIAAEWTQWGLAHVEVIAKARQQAAQALHPDALRRAIVETVARRPCTVDDLAQTFGASTTTLSEHLAALHDEGTLTTVEQQRGTFYKKAEQ